MENPSFNPSVNFRLGVASLSLIVASVFSFCSADGAIRTAVTSGAWFQPGTWSGKQIPVAGDSVVIPAGITVVANQSLEFANETVPLTLNIFGNLHFLAGKKISLPCHSVICLQSEGLIASAHEGEESVLAEICGTPVIRSGKSAITGRMVWDGNTAPTPAVTWSVLRVKKTAQCDALVIWSTLTETDNKSFTIERSGDGRVFEPIGTIKGSGTSKDPVAYSFADADPIKGISYYRVRQTSMDGTISYSGRTMLNITKDPSSGVHVSTNSAEGSVYIKTDSRDSEETWKIVLFDEQGNLQARTSATIAAEPVMLKINNGKLIPGKYTLLVHRPEGISSYDLEITR